MISLNAMSIMAAAAAGGTAAGYYGWKHASRNPDLDFDDRASFTASSAVAGIATGAGLMAIGPKRLGQGLKALASGSWFAGKGAGKVAGVAFKVKGPLALLALSAGAVGIIAYGARSNPPIKADAYRDDIGQTQYSVRDRSNMLGADGSMVFGLNNLRHG